MPKLAVELSAAYLVGRDEHVAAGLTAGAQEGFDLDIVYAWAMAMAVPRKPDGGFSGARRSFQVPTIDVKGGHRDAIVAGYRALVTAAANRNQAGAREMWTSRPVTQRQ